MQCLPTVWALRASPSSLWGTFSAKCQTVDFPSETRNLYHGTQVLQLSSVSFKVLA